MSDELSLNPIKQVFIDDQLFTNRGSVPDLIISYVKTNGKILAIHNLPHIKNFESVIDSLTRFWINFEGAQSIKQEIDLQIKSFSDLLASTMSIFKRLTSNFYIIYNRWQLDGKEAKEEMERELSKEPKVTREALKERVNFILQNMKKKELLLEKLREDRETEKERSKKFSEIEKKIKFAEEFLFHLDYFKKIDDDKKLEGIDNKFNTHCTEFDKFSTYSEEIMNEKILQKNQSLINLNKVKIECGELFKIFKEFSQNFEDLSVIYTNLTIREECMNIIHQKLGLFTEYSECLAVNKYYGAELEYWHHKQVGAKDKYLIHKTADKTFQYKKVMSNIKDNISYINSDIQGLSLKGDIDYTPVVQNLSDGCPNSSSTSRTYFTNVSSDFRLDKGNMTTKTYINPRDYDQSRDTLNHRESLTFFQNRHDEIEFYFKQNEEKVAFYQGLEKDIIQRFAKIEAEKGQKHEKLLQLLNKLKEFFQSLENIALIIDEALIVLLVSAFMKCINIRLKPGCCSFSPKLFTVANLRPEEFYSIFLKILKKNNKEVKGCCCNNEIDRVHNCSEISLDDLKSLIIVPEVLVAFKNSKDGKQVINQGILIEDCDISICNLLKEFAKIICLKQLLKFKIDESRSNSYIKLAQETLRNSLMVNKYKSLARALEKYEYKF